MSWEPSEWLRASQTPHNWPLGMDNSVAGNCPVRCGMFSSFLDLYSIDSGTSTSPSHDTQKCSNCPTVPSVQFFNHVQFFGTPWTLACQDSLSITNSQRLFKLMSMVLVMPSHPLSSPSPAFNLSQLQGLFQWVSSSHQVAKVLELQLQHQSFQWIFRTDFLYDWLAWSPCSPRDSQESSPTPQFKSTNSSVLSFLYGAILISIHDSWKNHSFD